MLLVSVTAIRELSDRGGFVSDLWVDPETLRQYATRVDGAAHSIATSSMPAELAAIAKCMPGSDTAAGASGAASAVRAPLKKVAGYYTAMAGSVRTSAGKYEAKDSELADKFSQIAP